MPKFTPANTLPTLPICFGPIMAVAMAENGALPQRIRIAKWGENIARGAGKEGQGKTFIVNETTAAVLASMQRARGFDLVTMDFEHQSDPAHPNYVKPPHHVAGHGRIEVVPGQGIDYISSDYTPTGAKHAADYPDVSGVFWTNKKGEVLFVSSVALCQNGAVEGAHFEEALAANVLRSLAASMNDIGGESMDDVERLNAAAREFLGFDDTALPADIARALEALIRQRRRTQDENEGAGKKPKTPINPDTTKTMDQTQIDKLAASVATLAEGQKTLLNRIETDAHNREVESVIAASVSAGKVVPAACKEKDEQGRYKMAPAAVTEVMGCIAATVQTEFKDGTAKPKAEASSASGDEEAIRASMGITKEQWEKGGIPQANEPAPSGVKIA